MTDTTNESPKGLPQWRILERRFRNSINKLEWDSLFAEAGDLLVEDHNLKIPTFIITNSGSKWRWTSALLFWGLDIKQNEQRRIIDRVQDAGFVIPYKTHLIDHDKFRKLSILLCREFYLGRRNLNPREQSQNVDDPLLAGSSNELPTTEEGGPDPVASAMTPKLQASDKANKFRNLPDLRWDEISMTIVSNDSLRIQARNISDRVHYIDMGFRDRRKKDLPIKAWHFLTDLADSKGEIGYGSNRHNSQAKSRAKDLRGILRGYFGIESDPFFDYNKCGAYRTRFTIRDKDDAI